MAEAGSAQQPAGSGVFSAADINHEMAERAAANAADDLRRKKSRRKRKNRRSKNCINLSIDRPINSDTAGAPRGRIWTKPSPGLSFSKRSV